MLELYVVRAIWACLDRLIARVWPNLGWYRVHAKMAKFGLTNGGKWFFHKQLFGMAKPAPSDDYGPVLTSYPLGCFGMLALMRVRIYETTKVGEEC